MDLFEKERAAFLELAAAIRTAINVSVNPLLREAKALIGRVGMTTVPRAEEVVDEVHDVLEQAKPILPVVQGVAAQAKDLLGRLNAGAEVEISIPREGEKPFVFSVRIKPDEDNST